MEESVSEGRPEDGRGEQQSRGEWAGGGEAEAPESTQGLVKGTGSCSESRGWGDRIGGGGGVLCLVCLIGASRGDIGYCEDNTGLGDPLGAATAQARGGGPLDQAAGRGLERGPPRAADAASQKLCAGVLRDGVWELLAGSLVKRSLQSSPPGDSGPWGLCWGPGV